jgi:hypothetical protein
MLITMEWLKENVKGDIFKYDAISMRVGVLMTITSLKKKFPDEIILHHDVEEVIENELSVLDIKS